MCVDNEIILGYDARELWEYNFVGEWQGRDVSFVGTLRSDLLKPLSVDRAIWGSLFAADLASGYSPLPEPSTKERQHPYHLWLRLADVNNALTQHAEYLVMPYCVIAVTWPPKNTITSMEECLKYNLRFYPTDPISLQAQANWKFLGYDVAEIDYGSLISAVSNNPPAEGYGDDIPFCELWGKRLNRHYLFEDLNQAIEYAHLSDVRVPEHSPFGVFGIWLIRAVGNWGMGKKGKQRDSSGME